jgi:hypothetical protein
MSAAAANKVLLKKSSVVSKVPLTTDLAYGELALNYADGLLYYKSANNVIQYFSDSNTSVTLTGTQTLTNKTLTSPTINGGALSGTFTGAPTLSDTTASTSSTTGSLKLGGGLGVAGNIYVGSASKVGFVNASNVSAVYQYYNAATNSLDTVFG